MAAKYWYIAGNGSSTWAAANWYNGPGGTLGTTTAPTTADDAYLTAESGSGTITITVAAACNSLTCTGFTGTLAGTSTLNVLSSIYLGSGMTLTYSGTTTINGAAGGEVSCNGKSFTGNVTFNSASATWTTYDFKTVSTATVTLTAGALVTTSAGTYGLECGIFLSTGTGIRSFWTSSSANNNWNIIGIGTVWNVSGSNITCWDSVASTITGNVLFLNSTSSTKTITHTLTGSNVPAFTTVGGSGTGAFTVTGNFYSLYVTNTGGASIAFGTATSIQSDLDFGASNVNWNSITTSTLSFIGSSTFTLSPNMTITSSGNITVTGGVSMYPNGKALTGTLTVNTADGWYVLDTFVNLGAVVLTSGTFTVFGGAGYGDAYIASLSSSNSNSRSISVRNLYFTGTGTLQTTTTATGLGYGVDNVYVINSTATAKTLAFSAVVYPAYGVYLAGSGSGSITVSPSTAGTFNVYVTNTGGAAISISTSTIALLEFSVGTNAVWTNAASQALTIQNSLYIASTAGSPTLTPSMIFTGALGVIYAGYYTVFITLNGKSLVTGAVTLNDTTFSPNSVNYILDGLSMTAGLTITSAQEVTFNGPASASLLTVTSAINVALNSSLTLAGVLSLANNVLENSITVVGNASMTILNQLSYGTARFNGTLNATTSITMSNAAGTSAITHYGALTTPSFSITNGNLTSYATVNVSGSLGLTVGSVIVNGSINYNLGAFASAGSGIRTISMGRGTWTLTGIGNPWSVAATNLFFDSGFTTINIINSSANTLGFAGGSLGYYTLQWNRGGATGACTISGNNSFVNFIDSGTGAHPLLFTQGNTQTIGNFVANGSPGNLITLNSVNGTNAFNLVKSPAGVVNCDYLNIQHSIATPSTGTWYAGPNSVNNQAILSIGSGWIFTNMPPRKLGAGGVG